MMDDTEHSPRERLRKPHLLIAWLVILAVVALFMVSAPTPREAVVDESEAGLAPTAMDDQLMTAQVAVGLRALGQKAAVDPEQVLSQVEAAADHPVEAWRSAALAGELLGEEAGRERLAAIQLEGHPQLATDVALLYQIYLEGSAALDAADRQRLRSRHGWFGQLALAFDLAADDPLRQELEQRAIRTAVTLSVLSLLVIALLVGGLVCSILAILQLRSGRLHSVYRPDASAPVAYGSAFALYLLAYLAFSGAVTLAAQQLPVLGSLWILWLFPLLFAPLLLGWLRMAGQGPSTALGQIGLHRGRGLWREAGAGILGYLAGLPLVCVGFIITAMLADGAGGIEHPVVEELRGGGASAILAALLLASVFAPVVEETMFRGVLYHHLRAWYGPPLAALLQGLIFAAVHPQGLAAIPVLASLGIVFALIREWRGSLVGPMVAHGLHNGGTMLVAILLLS